MADVPVTGIFSPSPPSPPAEKFCGFRLFFSLLAIKSLGLPVLISLFIMSKSPLSVPCLKSPSKPNPPTISLSTDGYGSSSTESPGTIVRYTFACNLMTALVLHFCIFSLLIMPSSLTVNKLPFLVTLSYPLTSSLAMNSSSSFYSPTLSSVPPNIGNFSIFSLLPPGWLTLI